MNGNKISVLILVYNVEQYLEECLNSCINQITNFDFEIVIGEDNSTDGSKEICRKFKQNHPDKVKLIENQTNLKFNRNFINTLNHCVGDYIAILDGDDKWIDNNKLQKQYDIITKNNFSMVCTNFYECNGNVTFKFYGHESKSRIIKYNDIVKNFITCTSSFLFNAKLMKEAIISFDNLAYNWVILDLPLFLYCSFFKDAYYLEDFTTIRNLRNESETVTQDYRKKIKILEGIKEIKEYFFDKYYVDNDIKNFHIISFERSLLFVYSEYINFNQAKKQFMKIKMIDKIILSDKILLFASYNKITNQIFIMLKKLYKKIYLNI